MKTLNKLIDTSIKVIKSTPPLSSARHLMIDHSINFIAGCIDHEGDKILKEKLKVIDKNSSLSYLLDYIKRLESLYQDKSFYENDLLKTEVNYLFLDSLDFLEGIKFELKRKKNKLFSLDNYLEEIQAQKKGKFIRWKQIKKNKNDDLRKKEIQLHLYFDLTGMINDHGEGDELDVFLLMNSLHLNDEELKNIRAFSFSSFFKFMDERIKGDFTKEACEERINEFLRKKAHDILIDGDKNPVRQFFELYLNAVKADKERKELKLRHLFEQGWTKTFITSKEKREYFFSRSLSYFEQKKEEKFNLILDLMSYIAPPKIEKERSKIEKCFDCPLDFIALSLKYSKEQIFSDLNVGFIVHILPNLKNRLPPRLHDLFIFSVIQKDYVLKYSFSYTKEINELIESIYTNKISRSESIKWLHRMKHQALNLNYKDMRRLFNFELSEQLIESGLEKLIENLHSIDIPPAPSLTFKKKVDEIYEDYNRISRQIAYFKKFIEKNYQDEGFQSLVDLWKRFLKLNEEFERFYLYHLPLYPKDENIRFRVRKQKIAFKILTEKYFTSEDLNFLDDHFMKDYSQQIFYYLNEKKDLYSKGSILIPTLEGLKLSNTDYYFKKLNPTLRKDFLLACCIGRITQCCQHIGGAGHSCVMHSVMDERGGIYILYQKTPDRDKDIFISQSWVWISTDGSLVLDSIEISKQITLSYDFLYDLYNELGSYIVNQKSIHQVLFGGQGSTPYEFIARAKMNPYSLNYDDVYEGYYQHVPVPLFHDYLNYSDARSESYVLYKNYEHDLDHINRLFSRYDDIFDCPYFIQWMRILMINRSTHAKGHIKRIEELSSDRLNRLMRILGKLNEREKDYCEEKNSLLNNSQELISIDEETFLIELCEDKDHLCLSTLSTDRYENDLLMRMLERDHGSEDIKNIIERAVDYYRKLYEDYDDIIDCSYFSPLIARAVKSKKTQFLSLLMSSEYKELQEFLLEKLYECKFDDLKSVLMLAQRRSGTQLAGLFCYLISERHYNLLSYLLSIKNVLLVPYDLILRKISHKEIQALIEKSTDEKNSQVFDLCLTLLERNIPAKINMMQAAIQNGTLDFFIKVFESEEERVWVDFGLYFVKEKQDIFFRVLRLLSDNGKKSILRVISEFFFEDELFAIKVLRYAFVNNDVLIGLELMDQEIFLSWSVGIDKIVDKNFLFTNISVGELILVLDYTHESWSRSAESGKLMLIVFYEFFLSKYPNELHSLQEFIFSQGKEKLILAYAELLAIMMKKKVNIRLYFDLPANSINDMIDLLWKNRVEVDFQNIMDICIKKYKLSQWLLLSKSSFRLSRQIFLGYLSEIKRSRTLLVMCLIEAEKLGYEDIVEHILILREASYLKSIVLDKLDISFSLERRILDHLEKETRENEDIRELKKYR